MAVFTRRRHEDPLPVPDDEPATAPPLAAQLSMARRELEDTEGQWAAAVEQVAVAIKARKAALTARSEIINRIALLESKLRSDRAESFVDPQLAELLAFVQDEMDEAQRVLKAAEAEWMGRVVAADAGQHGRNAGRLSDQADAAKVIYEAARDHWQRVAVRLQSLQLQHDHVVRRAQVEQVDAEGAMVADAYRRLRRGDA